MKRYSLGFVFNGSLDKVLLMHKLKPEWQAGKLNGLGGKVEEGETALSCISREIQEESGLVIPCDQWKFIGELNGEDWTTGVYGAIYHGPTEDAKSIEKEPINWFNPSTLPENIIPNLSWLVPLTIEKLKNEISTDFTTRSS